MANPIEQPAAGPHPPNMPHPLLPQPKKVAQPDEFISMIQGASIPFIVGAGTSSRIFTLPVGLLSHHSIFLQNQFVYLSGIRVSHNMSKKRKLSETQDEDDGGSIKSQPRGELKMGTKAEMETGRKATEEDVKNPEMIIRLPDVDPVIFGFFLNFIYKDAYPDNVDAIAALGAVHPPSGNPTYSFTPIAPPRFPAVKNSGAGKNPNGLRMHSGPAKSKPQGTSTGTAHQSPLHNTSVSNGTAASKLSRISPYGPHQPTGPQPNPPSTVIPAPHSNQSISIPPSSIPPSIHAYLLAHRLNACAFMNYTTTRLYMAIGLDFSLTPLLIAYIWRQTQSFLPGCSLRRLILDFLISFWSHPDPAIHHRVIQRGVDWDALFDEHKGLRNEFIKGLQGGVRVLPVKRYHVTLVSGRKEGVRDGGAKEGETITQEGGAIAEGGNGVTKEGGETCLAITEGRAVTKTIGGMADSGDEDTKNGNGGAKECSTVVVKLEKE
ncbi:hypothetical protein DDE82_002577 [Stemphylium lycopersici]|uniref:BTB domain-containing protein n=1 Tax=Stemphylium lycopersici TaxID=183478 RepID=A0A364ND79_STELY|nr:hypothetical protein DDE82_002577 [Stemphylium lycopersici]RAR15093.1 hypothetical protein DDE83_001530 [Stemphylium lycopersici]